LVEVAGESIGLVQVCEAHGRPHSQVVVERVAVARFEEFAIHLFVRADVPVC
jgi:hypothetical protein